MGLKDFSKARPPPCPPPPLLPTLPLQPPPSSTITNPSPSSPSPPHSQLAAPSPTEPPSSARNNPEVPLPVTEAPLPYNSTGFLQWQLQGCTFNTGNNTNHSGTQNNGSIQFGNYRI